MAAIIAQLAAANRKRKQKAKHTLPPDKSNLALPPFDPCFDPQKHNRYLRLKKLVEHRRSVLTKAKGMYVLTALQYIFAVELFGKKLNFFYSDRRLQQKCD